MHAVSRGDGLPILALHGFTGDYRNLLPIDDALDGPSGWQRIYVDLPGHGDTVAGPEIDGSDAVADSVAGFVTERFGDSPFAVVGYSFGGLIARHLASIRPSQVLGLALLCRLVVADPAARALPAPSDGFVPSDDPEYPSRFDQAVTDRIWANYALTREPENVATYPGPTTIITGRQDDVVGWADQQTLAALYPRATFAVLDRAGHNAQLDRPELVAALLRDWVSRMEQE